MLKFCGDILDGDRVVLADVNGQIDVVMPRPAKLGLDEQTGLDVILARERPGEWSGRFELPTDNVPDEIMSGGYHRSLARGHRLRLKDDRKGDILLKAMTATAGGVAVFKFEGTGLPPMYQASPGYYDTMELEKQENAREVLSDARRNANATA
jgi:hypothetical protein